MRRKMWRVWQKFLRVSIPLNLISWLICACCIDSKSIIPAVICIINGMWLSLICAANTPKNERRGYEDEISIKDLAS